MKTTTEPATPRLLRRKDAARVLGISESMCFGLERKGLLTPLHLTSVGRTVRYEAAAVYALADRLIAEAAHKVG
jgi:hypothetical protein